MLGSRPAKWLQKKAKKGPSGHPVGTVAYYGPDNQCATKVAVAIVPFPDATPASLRRWFVEEGDIRRDEAIQEEMVAFLREQGARSVAMVGGIIGCPHEEGVDYPEGEACPACPFWADRDRWAEALPSDT